MDPKFSARDLDNTPQLDNELFDKQTSEDSGLDIIGDASKGSQAS